MHKREYKVFSDTYGWFRVQMSWDKSDSIPYSLIVDLMDKARASVSHQPVQDNKIVIHLNNYSSKTVEADRFLRDIEKFILPFEFKKIEEVIDDYQITKHSTYLSENGRVGNANFTMTRYNAGRFFDEYELKIEVKFDRNLKKWWVDIKKS